VLLDRPGGTYWENFEKFLRDELLARHYINEEDLSLYRLTHDPIEAVREIDGFYRTYHSQRVVGKRLVMRLNHEPSDKILEILADEFADIMDGGITRVKATSAEVRDDDVPDLPRIAFHFNRAFTGRLRQMIDRLNDLAEDLG
jgi:hypothetical protein